MKIKATIFLGLLIAISSIATASSFEDDDFFEDNWFDNDDDFFGDNWFDDRSDNDHSEEETTTCNGIEVGNADTEVRVDGNSLNVEGTYCANTAGYSVASEEINVNGDEIEASVDIESPEDDQSVAQVITPVDYAVDTELDDGDYSLFYNIMLDGSTVDSGEEDISIDNQEPEQETDDFFGDDWFNDDFFNDETPDEPDESEEDENGETSLEDGSDESDGADDSDESDESTVSEEAYIEAAPEPGDFYYQAGTDDWVSYVNPRDEYKRDYASYQGEGSGKICVTLLNEEGDHIIGESVPDTEVNIPTGESLDWHPYANPMNVQFPMNEHYERPLDSDQFGTTDSLPQGDGYMDSHCIEIHDLAEDATVEYGEAEISGTYADDIKVVGYIQQANEAWDTDVDPIEDAQSYEEAGGGWTMYEGGSHGQAVVVLQLDR